MKRIFLAAIVAAAAFPAFALTLQEARTRGLVCEQADGMLAIKSGGGEVSALTAEINAKRAAEYQRISKQNQQPADVVAKLAVPQILKQPGAVACK